MRASISSGWYFPFVVALFLFFVAGLIVIVFIRPLWVSLLRIGGGRWQGELVSQRRSRSPWGRGGEEEHHTDQPVQILL